MTEQPYPNFADPEPPARQVTPDPSDPVVLRFSSPEGLLAAIPYLWGFHPSHSLVVLGLRGPAERQRDCYGARIDLPGDTGASGSGVGAVNRGRGDTDDERALQRVAESIAAGLVHRGAERALLVAYSTDVVAAHRAVDAVSAALTAASVPIAEALRSDGGRWWSFRCADPACCPPGGTPYDLAAHQVTATAVFAGCHAYADREAVGDLVRPLQGDTREDMLEATERAEDQLTTMWTDVYGSGTDHQVDVDAVPGRCAVIVANLLSRLLAEPVPPSMDETAQLAVFTASLPVRDAAWFRMTEEDAARHVRLWRWVTQRAVPPYEPAPAALLAFAAWLSGDNLLARAALDRAFAADPEYGLAQIVADAVRRGVSPTIWRRVRAGAAPTVGASAYAGEPGE